MKKFKQNHPIKVSELLRQACDSLGLNERMKDLELMNLWNDVAFEFGSTKFQEKTKAHRLIKGTLFIGIKSASLANELQMLKPQLERRFLELANIKKLPKISKIVFELR